VQQLEVGNAVVVAPPGAGKSTALPLFLLQHARFKDCKIVMLQPRRIAARNIAEYLAQQLGENVGQTVGYRVRGESNVGQSTRLEIVTEGILTRMLQSSPELSGVGLIVFDEFHERSVHADFSLALSIEVQQALRKDLRLLVMSATLDAQNIARIMPDAMLLESKGKSYPVNVHYVGNKTKMTLINQVAQLVIAQFDNYRYDFLVFLPGVYEIRKLAALLSEKLSNAVVLPLFSDLKKEQQQMALSPDKQGRRKIVLATNIAETSLTIKGIEVVIDSGLERKAAFDLRRGITQLSIQKISQASATQRAGRAGRLMAGTCFRLWSKDIHDRLSAHSPPEILQVDVSNLVLEAAIWGAPVTELALLDHPSDAQLARATQTLGGLAAIDKAQQVTQLGRQVHLLGGDIHIAMMLLRSAALGPSHQSLACALAALLESKDPLPDKLSAELSLRLAFLLNNRHHSIWLLIKQWHRKLNILITQWPVHDTGLILAFGFPHWIAKHSEQGRFSLANGSGAVLNSQDNLMHVLQNNNTSHSLSSWLAIGHMQLIDKNAVIRYAEPIDASLLKKYFGHLRYDKESVQWDADKHKITAFSADYFAAILVSKKALPNPSADALEQAWLTHIEKVGVYSLPFDKRSLQLSQRVSLFNVNTEPPLPDFSETGLMATIEEWLLPYLRDKSTWQALSHLPFYQLLSQRLDYQQLTKLNACLPETILIPTGRYAAIEYNQNRKAILSVRVQELYGMTQHPTLLNGSLPITCELLSPANRPVQTTEDIVGFWNGSYVQIQKEMKGRYPRHYWPDDPANSQATSVTKKRMHAKHGDV